MQITADIAPLDDVFDWITGIVFYPIAQEAVTNSQKNAEAFRVRIVLHRDDR